MRTICVLWAVALALTALLVAGCGGGGDTGAKVEASLRQYLSTIDAQACLGSRFCGQGVFPIGAGPPHVKARSCKKTRTGGWSCVITFAHGKVELPVAVAAKGSGKVYWAAPMGGPALSPARVYAGGPGHSPP